MHEKAHIYESTPFTTLKPKAPANGAPAQAMDKKWRRTGQKPQKNTQEMIAIVLRLIEYFENS